MKVTVRHKPISGGKLRLYLDYYPPIIHPESGKPTRREFLKLYLFEKPQTSDQREHNKEIKMLADKISSKRTLELDKGEYGFLEKNKKNVDFLQYYLQVAEKKKLRSGTYDTWLSSYNYLKRFTKGHCLISDLSVKFGEDYREYLLTTPSVKSYKVKLSQNAALSYFNKFKAALKQAYQDRLLKEDLNSRIEVIKQQETHREFLTLEELQRLATTECDYPHLKSASLFSCLTGLRWSDIVKLTWGEIQHSEAEGHYIRYIQKKGHGAETLPISATAKDLLGPTGNAEDHVFRNLRYSAHYSVVLGRWMLKAGITKKITFHNFRHTYATLQLSQGTDIYTVSKMLGHKDLKTTQVYVKIIDEKKREAADKIKLK
jgi:integrase